MSFLHRLQSVRSASFGLHLNTAKCNVFWPSTDQYFPEFRVDIQCVEAITKGAYFLELLVWFKRLLQEVIGKTHQQSS